MMMFVALMLASPSQILAAVTHFDSQVPET